MKNIAKPYVQDVPRYLSKKKKEKSCTKAKQQDNIPVKYFLFNSYCVC